LVIVVNFSEFFWCLLNRFHTAQGHSGACRNRWCLTDS